MARVFLTRRLPFAEPFAIAGGELEVFPEDRAPTAEELARGAAESEAIVAVLPSRVDAALLETCPRLRLVANVAVGFDNVDVAAATARGVWVTNTPDVLTNATAELAFALVLATARRLGEAERLVRGGEWRGFSPSLLLGRELAGATLGVYGLGRIGAAVARLGGAFGMRCLATSGGSRAIGERAHGAEIVDRETLLRESDVVSIHCPSTPATRHAFDAAAFAAMKRGALLVNTARGAIVDERALAEALASGHLGGAGLDVFEDEPNVLPALLAAPNAIVLPHVGSATVTARTAMARLAFTDVARVLGGERPLHPVNEPVPFAHEKR